MIRADPTAFAVNVLELPAPPVVVTVTLSLRNFAWAGTRLETEATEVRSDSWSRGGQRGLQTADSMVGSSLAS